jgi:hypothetical protein
MIRMKKTKSRKRGPARKPETGAQLVDEYLGGFTEPARTILKKVRAIIRSVRPAVATEGISYGIPRFKYKGMRASIAAFSNHRSLFSGRGADGQVQERTEALRNLERHDPLRTGEAFAGRSSRKRW